MCSTALRERREYFSSLLGVSKTPTFFVNGRPLPSFGVDQLTALVAEEVAKFKK